MLCTLFRTVCASIWVLGTPTRLDDSSSSNNRDHTTNEPLPWLRRSQDSPTIINRFNHLTLLLEDREATSLVDIPHHLLHRCNRISLSPPLGVECNHS
jgi:hypothetical protein